MTAKPARSGDARRIVLLVGVRAHSDSLTQELTRRGFRPGVVSQRETLLAAVTEHRPSVLVLPESGDRTADTTLLLRLLEIDARLGVVIAGAEIDAESVAHFHRLGAAACVGLGVPANAVAEAVTLAMELREKQIRADRETASLRASLRDVTHQIDLEAGAVRSRWIGSLESLVRVGEASHPHWAGHALRVADLSAALAARMGESDAFVEQIRIAGRLHDLGMIGIPARLLEKRGSLTEGEMELIRYHPVFACDILSGYPEFGEITLAIRGHHEHWDGSGYPDRLAGTNIPPMARILAAAEVFDALTSPRPYQAAEDTATALRRIRVLAGSLLDPAVCNALPRVLADRNILSFVDDSRLPRRELTAVGALQGETAA